jgi:hypothetical protein
MARNKFRTPTATARNKFRTPTATATDYLSTYN